MLSSVFFSILYLHYLTAGHGLGMSAIQVYQPDVPGAGRSCGGTIFLAKFFGFQVIPSQVATPMILLSGIYGFSSWEITILI